MARADVSCDKMNAPSAPVANSYFKGCIDELKIYNTNLTSTQVEDLYTQTLQLVYIPKISQLNFNNTPNQDDNIYIQGSKGVDTYKKIKSTGQTQYNNTAERKIRLKLITKERY